MRQNSSESASTRVVGRNDPRCSRRDLLEWLGSAAVLSLSAGLLRACSDGGAGVDRRDEASDAGIGPGHDGGRAAGGTEGGQPAGFGFAPGPGSQAVFNGWGERTVDEQNLAELLAGWRLRVDGLVMARLTLNFAELLALPRHDQLTDFHCVEGWSIDDVPWNGVRVDTLLDRSRVTDQATHITLHAAGGVYRESLPLAVAREPKTMLAYGIAEATLPLPHGFPLRMVVPRLFGYKNAKYINRIEVTDGPIDGFWVAMGYPYEGLVPAERLRPGKY